MNINDLIAQIQAAVQGTSGNVTVNINLNQPSVEAPVVDDEVVDEDVPCTDFDEGDRVLVCHIRKNGERVHTMGTVIESLGKDDKGWYTRVAGDNGKHYRTGLVYNEERLGSMIVWLDKDVD